MRSSTANVAWNVRVSGPRRPGSAQTQPPSRSGPEVVPYVRQKTSHDIAAPCPRRPRGNGRPKCVANDLKVVVSEGDIICRISLERGSDRRSSNDPQRGVGQDQTPLGMATSSRLGTSRTLDLSRERAQLSFSGLQS